MTVLQTVFAVKLKKIIILSEAAEPEVVLFYTPHTWSHRGDPQHFPACWLENKPSPGPVEAGKSMFWATDQTDFEIAVNNSRVGFFGCFCLMVKSLTLP